MQISIRQARDILGLDPLADAGTVETAAAMERRQRLANGDSIDAVEQARSVLLEALLHLPEQAHINTIDLESVHPSEHTAELPSLRLRLLVAAKLALFGTVVLLGAPLVDLAFVRTDDPSFLPVTIGSATLLLVVGARMHRKAREANPSFTDWAALFLGLEGGAMLGFALYQPPFPAAVIWFPLGALLCLILSTLAAFKRAIWSPLTSLPPQSSH